MGVKTKNYVTKETGVPLTEAYAKLSTLVVEKSNDVRAVFVIQSSREATDKLAPLEKVSVSFKWDRKSNPVERAYEAAKKQKVRVEDEVTHEVKMKNGSLFGWEDDIVDIVEE